MVNQPNSASVQKHKTEVMAFEQVYERYYFDVFRFFIKRIENRQEAEDLTSDVFLYCYKNYNRYDSKKSAISTWLFLVAKSMLKTYYRDRKQHLDISDFEDWLLADATDMSRAVYLEQLRRFLTEQIKTLPEKQQQVIIMRFFQEKDFDEIAIALDTSQGNIRVMLTRAIAKLKNSLSNTECDWRE